MGSSLHTPQLQSSAHISSISPNSPSPSRKYDCKINEIEQCYFINTVHISLCCTVHFNIRHASMENCPCKIFKMVSYFLCWTLLNFFNSIRDNHCQQVVLAVGRNTCTMINTSNEIKCSLLRAFWIYNFFRRIFQRVSAGRIVNIRNRDLHGSCDLFVPRSHSFPMNPEKRQSLNNYNKTMYLIY